jgi:hypothetical protein
MESVVSQNSVTAWFELLCIGKILFCKPDTGFASDSARRSAEISNLIKSRAQRWSDGHKSELIIETLRCRKSHANLNADSMMHDEVAIRRAKRFANEGDLSKAVSELGNDSLPVFSKSVLMELKKLHPIPIKPVMVLGDNSDSMINLSIEEVLSAINFSKKDPVADQEVLGHHL